MRDLRADTVFMGASAIDLETGFMTEQVAEIAVDRALRAMAREAVILADSSKFDRVAPGFMFGFEQVGTLVTDDGRPEFDRRRTRCPRHPGHGRDGRRCCCRRS